MKKIRILFTALWGEEITYSLFEVRTRVRNQDKLIKLIDETDEMLVDDCLAGFQGQYPHNILGYLKSKKHICSYEFICRSTFKAVGSDEFSVSGVDVFYEMR